MAIEKCSIIMTSQEERNKNLKLEKVPNDLDFVLWYAVDKNLEFVTSNDIAIKKW